MIVEFFLKWAQTARVTERAAAAAALARAFCEGTLAFEDRCAAEAALTFLLDDPSPRVRAAMADALSMSRHAPPQVVAALAADQPDVASVVIARSPLLSEADLIERVASGLAATQCLVAERAGLSMAMAAALAEVGHLEACLTLLGNEDAEIAPLSFRRLCERFGDVPAMREALSGDRRLPTDCRHVLLVKLGETFRRSPLVSALMGGDRAERILRDACVKSALTLVEATPVAEHAALVEHLRLREELTPSFLVRLVACGRIDFFGSALVSLAARTADRVRKLLATGQDAALSALFSEAGLAKGLHAILLRALHLWREVAAGRRTTGTQEVSFLMLQELGGASAGGELATLLKSIHLDALRSNARQHAQLLAAA